MWGFFPLSFLLFPFLFLSPVDVSFMDSQGAAQHSPVCNAKTGKVSEEYVCYPPLPDKVQSQTEHFLWCFFGVGEDNLTCLEGSCAQS